ncbi:MAG: hypothetical protein RMK29_06060 [Myxococcales bacterium]|nr:hypothetical protein [Myxococcota bacterium]MDW8281255.1 hypothetical protein [Myxococcales bacterium]
MTRRWLSWAVGLLPLAWAGCIVTPDPCAGYPLACIAVTVESGPRDTYQLLVTVLGFSSTTPLTPRQRPTEPLVYPLRFAVRFSEFDHRHRGQVTLDVRALDADNEVRGQARATVAIDNMEKHHLRLTLGTPFDMALPLDQASPPDLQEPPDGTDLAQGPAGD